MKHTSRVCVVSAVALALIAGGVSAGASGGSARAAEAVAPAASPTAPAAVPSSGVAPTEGATPAPTAAPAPTPAPSPGPPAPTAPTPAPTPTAAPPIAEAPTAAPGDDPSLTEQDDAGNHAMGSTVPAHTPTAAPRARSLVAVPAGNPNGVQGMDVSAWQPSVDWNAAWNLGARFAYIKATEGTGYRSSTFTQQYSGSAAVGMLHGAYHFATPNTSSGAAQANYFVSNGGTWTPDGKTLPPLLDIEYGTNGTGTCWGLSQAAMVGWIHDFVNTVAARTGRPPAIYSTTDWWQQCTGNSNAFGNNPLMVARYGPSLAAGPGSLGASWPNWSIWQYDDAHGPFPGDSDIFNGTQADLVYFATNVVSSADALSRSPFGNVEQAVSAPGGIRISGWAIDPDTTDPISVHVYVDNAGYAIEADGVRDDVGAAYPGRGSKHGYDSVVPAAPGLHGVCAYGYNVGAGASRLLKDCTNVSVLSSRPIGFLDAVTVISPSQLKIEGWSLEGDYNGPIGVAVYVDSTGQHITANTNRPDVGAAFPGYGSAHGYSVIMNVPSGQHRVCTYALNQSGVGDNPNLGCMTVTNVNHTPIGAADEIVGGKGTIRVSGWALDSDTPLTSGIVAVYVGTKGDTYSANLPRPDVARAYPGTGSNHGYSDTFAASKGSHQVCVYAIDTSDGVNNTQIRCQTVTVS